MNQSHGLRRTNADKRRAVETLLSDDEWNTWSDREIARRCGVSHNFVSELRKMYLSSDDRYESPRLAIRNGTTYEVDISNIGKYRPIEYQQAAPPPVLPRPVSMLDVVTEGDEDIPESYYAKCDECYERAWMDSASASLFGEEGVWVCRSCGYAYPPDCQPAKISDDDTDDDDLNNTDDALDEEDTARVANDLALRTAYESYRTNPKAEYVHPDIAASAGAATQ